MTVMKRALLRARGDLVEVCGKCKRGSTTSQREPRFKVESMVNSCVEPRQACLLSREPANAASRLCAVASASFVCRPAHDLCPISSSS